MFVQILQEYWGKSFEGGKRVLQKNSTALRRPITRLMSSTHATLTCDAHHTRYSDVHHTRYSDVHDTRYSDPDTRRYERIVRGYIYRNTHSLLQHSHWSWPTYLRQLLYHKYTASMIRILQHITRRCFTIKYIYTKEPCNRNANQAISKYVVEYLHYM